MSSSLLAISLLDLGSTGTFLAFYQTAFLLVSKTVQNRLVFMPQLDSSGGLYAMWWLVDDMFNEASGGNPV